MVRLLGLALPVAASFTPVAAGGGMPTAAGIRLGPHEVANSLGAGGPPVAARRCPWEPL